MQDFSHQQYHLPKGQNKTMSFCCWWRPWDATHNNQPHIYTLYSGYLLGIYKYIYIYIWSNYSDLTRPHPKWWFSKGNPLISGKSRLVKYYNLGRYIYIYIFFFSRSEGLLGGLNSSGTIPRVPPFFL